MDAEGRPTLTPEIPDVLRPLMGKARTALVLGSGLSGLLDRFPDRTDVDYDEIEGFPRAPYEVVGHGGRLSLAESDDIAALVFQGRVHAYQGVSAFDASYPARLAHAMGCDTFIVTNAAGGVDPSIAPGEIMLITDHINLTGDSPLRGWPGPEGGVPFIPMGDAYDPELISLAVGAAAERGLSPRQGVYAGVLGPAFETPAEVAALEAMGAHAVGMSTVPEVIAARALGLRVLGISLVSNAAGGSDLSHEEVLEAGAKAADVLTGLVLAILGRLDT